MPMPTSVRLVTWLILGLVLSVLPAAAQPAKARYEAALEREGEVRSLLDEDSGLPAEERLDALRQVTRLVASYEGIVRRYPTTGYSDNALWQGGSLAEAAYRRFGRADDRNTAARLYNWLVREYPTSPLVKRARTQIAGLEKAEAVESTAPGCPALPRQSPPGPPLLRPRRLRPLVELAADCPAGRARHRGSALPSHRDQRAHACDADGHSAGRAAGQRARDPVARSRGAVLRGAHRRPRSRLLRSAGAQLAAPLVDKVISLLRTTSSGRSVRAGIRTGRFAWCSPSTESPATASSRSITRIGW